jgi:hypothetical protein
MWRDGPHIGWNAAAVVVWLAGAVFVFRGFVPSYLRRGWNKTLFVLVFLLVDFVVDGFVVPVGAIAVLAALALDRRSTDA